MVLPGGPDHSVSLAIAPDDLRQLADHEATSRTFPGGAGPLAALDTGGDGARGTVLLVAGYTGSKEDFAPLLAPMAEAGLPRRRHRPARAVRVARPRRPGAYSIDVLADDVLAVARLLRAESGGPAAPARATASAVWSPGPPCWPNRRCSPPSRCSARAPRG